jgi:hypothetical protein
LRVVSNKEAKDGEAALNEDRTQSLFNDSEEESVESDIEKEFVNRPRLEPEDREQEFVEVGVVDFVDDELEKGDWIGDIGEPCSAGCGEEVIHDVEECELI